MAVIVSCSDIVMSEADQYASFVITLDQAQSGPVTLSYQTLDGTTYYYNDYTQAGATPLTFAAGETSKTVQISLKNDSTAENPETFYLKLSTTQTGVTLADSLVRATIIDNESVMVAPIVTVSDPVVDETDGKAYFTLTLNGASASTVSMDVSTANGTATSGSDYTALSQTVSFAPGETAKTVAVDLLNEGTQEGIETFGLVVSNLVNATMTDTKGTASIGANDATAAAAVVVSAADIVVGEGAQYAEFVVALNKPCTTNVTLSYETVDGTTYAYYDYDDLAATSLVFAAGETTKTVRIALKNDITAESPDSFYLKLSTTQPGVTVADSLVRATMIDNDTALITPLLSISDPVVDEGDGRAYFTLNLNGASANEVTLDVATANGTATSGSDYTAVSQTVSFAPGETAKTVAVDLLNEGTQEGIETFGLVVSNLVNATMTDTKGTASIGANDATAAAAVVVSAADIVVGEGAQYAEFVVTLDKPCTTNVTLSYETVDGTTYYYNDYDDLAATSLVFAAGETTKTVRIALKDDSTAENPDSFYLKLSTTQPGVTVADSLVRATMIDNDTDLVMPIVTISDPVVDEGDGRAYFTLNLNGASANEVTLDVATANGTATSGSDYTALSQTVSFAPGETAKTVAVDLLNEGTQEGIETFGLVVSNLVNATMTDTKGTASIGANDATAAAAVVVSAADIVVGEGAQYAEFVVALNKPCTTNVTLSYETVDGTTYAYYDYDDLAATSLVFAAGETTKTVRIALKNDSTVESPETFYLKLSTTQPGVTVATPQVTANLIDDEFLDANNILTIRNIMDKGDGDDQYVITDVVNDYITEDADGGIDTLSFDQSYTMAEGGLKAMYVENLTLTGTAAIDGTGNSLKNVLTGNNAANKLGGLAGNDTLIGNGGNDTLNGGSGKDGMKGGKGNDTYLVDNIGDKVTELASQGTDLVQSSVTYTLGANVEKLTLTGSKSINGTGNVASNVITGNNAANKMNGLTGNDTLIGNGGNDTLNGGTGADSMKGGAGNDTYVVDNAADKVTELASQGADTVQSGISYTLAANLENLILTGNANINGTGNTLGNLIVASSGNNVLNGGAGVDTLSYAGHAGGVTASLARTTAQATGGSGTDTILNFENLTGGAGNDSLTGNAGANVLDGGAGADTMAGGAGNDTYYVERAADVVDETTALGKDTGGVDTVISSVSYVLSPYLELLTLTGTANINGTGNAQNNTIVANKGNNVLAGGSGKDMVSFEAATAKVTVNLALTSAQATGGSGKDTLSGFEDIRGGKAGDSLTGTSAANLIDGHTGADVMKGGAGNDTYVVDNSGDIVTELAGPGIDTVQSGITYALVANVENMTLTGTAAINGTGNELNNVLTGNGAANKLTGLAGSDKLIGGAGNDTLSGGEANDVLTGGTGADMFLFGDTYYGGNIDKVTDFNVAADTIQLDNWWFYSLSVPAGSTLAAADFYQGAAAHDASDRIIYNKSTGALLFDYDGTGAGVAVQFATLSTGLSMTNADFFVV